MSTSVVSGSTKAEKSAPEPSNGTKEESASELMTKDTLSRLLGAVSFGYGMFQLAMSLLPEKVLKLIEFLGFHTEKETGLKALGNDVA